MKLLVGLIEVVVWMVGVVSRMVVSSGMWMFFIGDFLR